GDQLAGACVLVLLVEPAWALDPGFQLSAAATLGLLLFASAARSRGDPGGPHAAARRGPAAVARGLRLGVASVRGLGAALASTALVTARHFQTLTPAALLANLFAVPVAALLLFDGILILALEPVCHPAAWVLMRVAARLVGGLDLASGIAAAAPAAS